MTDPGTAYKATAEGLKQGAKIANQGAKIAEAAYQAKASKEHLRQIATPKYTINIRLTNSTPNQWTFPRAYFRQGTADHNPDLRVEAGDETEWEVNLYALTSTGVEGVIAFTIAPNLTLVVLFRMVRGSRFLVKKENAWGVEIVETSTLKKKNRVKLYEYLVKPENRNRGNCSAFSKTYPDANKPYTVIGAMANSDTPELVVHVRERSNTARARSMSAPPLPTTQTPESTLATDKRQRAESLPMSAPPLPTSTQTSPLATDRRQRAESLPMSAPPLPTSTQTSESPPLATDRRQRAESLPMSAPPLPTSTQMSESPPLATDRRQGAESLPEEDYEFVWPPGPMTMQMKTFPSFSSMQRRANLEALGKSAHLEMEGEPPELEIEASPPPLPRKESREKLIKDSSSSFQRISAQVYQTIQMS
ncbi:uncharacterized protein [Oscarella lobularis]|uniref:uncharacterized protein n=1 Tax=Oscarella lobularis TaxID=121494 RepID=UPI0033138A24